MNHIIDHANKIINYIIDRENYDPEHLKSLINQMYPGMGTKEYSRITMNTESYIDYTQDREMMSWRIGDGEIKIPEESILPLYREGQSQPAHNVPISEIVIKPLGSITFAEAYLDRRQTPDQLRAELRDIYEPIFERKVKDSEPGSGWMLSPDIITL
ncbi:hypothetical protein HQ533_05705 [Candidatus Woesearchaeota archaeon]|nr:hypothetical protein [Candidatus Woesearchaeota archaeon]